MKHIILLLLSGIGFFQQILCQQHYNIPVSQYFANRYLANPAFAGSHTSPYVYALANRSWLGFEGAPVLVQFTGDMAFTKHAAGGIQLLSDNANELQRMLARLSYAYTIHTGGEKESLKLGFSLSTYRERITNSEPDGVIDPSVKALNETSWRFDGDFGAVYSSDHFFASATVFNLNRWYSKLLSKQPVDLETLSIMTGYTFDTDNEISIQPLAAAKFYTRTHWLLRAGGEFNYDKKLQVSLLWQNNQSIYGSIRLPLKETGEVNFSYGSGNKQGYGQLFEVGLGVHLK